MSLIKTWRFALWVFLTLLAIYAIAPNPLSKGTIVSSSALTQIKAGDIVYAVDGDSTNAHSFDNPYFGLIKFSTSRGDVWIQANGTLNITTKPAKTSNLNFGLDVEGGVRAVLKPNISDEATIDQVIGTLQTRINVYGLREANFRAIESERERFVEISIAGGTKSELEDLLSRQGRFEAKIPLNLKIAGNKTIIQLDKGYDISILKGQVKVAGQEVSENFSLLGASIVEDKILVDGREVSNGEKFTLGNAEFIFGGIIGNSLNITASIFTGDDVRIVYSDSQRSGLQPTQEGYRWFFQVLLTEDASKRFAHVTQNLDRIISSSDSYLSSPLQLYLDNEFVDSLNIAGDLKGKEVSEPSITGFSVTQEDSTKNLRRLQSILRSGSLPTNTELVQLDVISPKLGTGFLQNVLLSIIAAIILISLIVSVRYKKIKFIFPILVVSFSEIILILGASVLIGWTIDMASIAAIIALLGTGIDSQIIIIDQALRKEEEHVVTIRDRLGKAFFIVFGAAGTVIGAMLPLMALGLGVLRGFAITTIIGVLIGVLIARPAFAEIIKKIV